MPAGGATTYYLTQFCRKLHENERNWNERRWGGGRDSSPKRGPIGSANANVTCEPDLAVLENVQRLQSASAALVIIYVVFDNNFLWKSLDW